MNDLPIGLLHIAGIEAERLWREYVIEEAERVAEQMRHLPEVIDE